MIQSLKKWFQINRRDLPWRIERNSYRVWIAEVMLQQTQVSTVIPYFLRWMKQFPTIDSLFNRPLPTLMKAWEGIGYYNRVRNIYESAKIISIDYKGTLPEKRKDLLSLPGIGSYIAGAILNFAFHKKAAAVDSNVVRFLTRFYGDQPSSGKQRFFEELAYSLLPEEESWVVMEAMIELGALVCRKKAQCQICPLKESCRANAQKITHLLPTAKPSIHITKLERAVAIICWNDYLLVRQEKNQRVMRGLYEFPYTKLGEPFAFPLLLTYIETFPTVTHRFTKYQATLHPTLYIVPEAKQIKEFEWIEKEKLYLLPFSSGHREILKKLEQRN